MELTSTTLSEYTSESPPPEKQRLIEIAAGPDGNSDAWDTFMMNLYDGCAPTREVRIVDDADLLARVRETVEAHVDVKYHSEAPHSDRAYNAKKSLLAAIDAQVAAIEFPDSAEWPVDESLVEFIHTIDAPTTWSADFHRDSWEYVWNECTADDFQFIREALRLVYGTSGTRPAVDGVLNSFLYYADTDVTVEDIFSIPRRGKGAPRHVVIDNLDDVMQRLDPVVGAMLSHWVTEVKTNKGDRKRGGYYNYSSRHINITNSRTADSQHGTTTAHELGHALHHLYQFRPAPGTVDNRNDDPSEWEWDVPAPKHDETSSSQDVLQACVRMEWGKLRSGEIEPLRGYQTKNAAEFFADAFGCWVCNPDLLDTRQPGMKRLFDAHFAPRSRNTAPLREQIFDYWGLNIAQTDDSGRGVC